jgi:DNA mismatch endonuclease (patch repair protein)
MLAKRRAEARVTDGRFTGDPIEVSARMRRIRARGTKPEMKMSEVLARRGLHFEQHVRVSGINVDFLVEDRLALFVDSPYWHLRDTVTLQRLSPYWQERLLTNRRRDRKQTTILRAGGFSVLRIWADEIDAEKIGIRVDRCLTRLVRKATPPASSSSPSQVLWKQPDSSS